MVFEVDDHAEAAKLQSDPIIIESSLDQYVIREISLLCVADHSLL